MLRSRFLWQLLAGYTLLILLATAIVAILVANRIEDDSLDETRRSLEVRAQLLRELAAAPLTNGPSPRFQQEIRRMGSEIGTRLTVIRADGTVLADSEEDPSTMDNHGTRPEVLASKSEGIGAATRFSDTLGTAMMYLALPVERDGQVTGYVRTSLTLEKVDRRLSTLRTIVFFGVGVALLVALAAGFLAIRNISRPLEIMASVATSIAEGDYGKRLSFSRNDEIGKLAESFNKMAQASAERVEKLTTRSSELSTILSGMVEGLVAIDLRENIVQINSMGGNILRVSPDHAIGRPIGEMTQVHEVGDILSDTITQKKGLRRNLVIPGGPRDRFIEMRSSPLTGAHEDPVGAMVVLYDVTELHRLERIRRDFVANVSHELKTPITAIRGLVETLIEDREIDPVIESRFLRKARDQTLRLSSIVTDLLTLSRLESEESVFERLPVDLRDAVLNPARALQATGEQRGISINIQVPNHAVMVLGDKEVLSEITTNLLDNALKYTPEGGRVWLRLTQEADHGMLEVEDTGIGIESEEQDRIFERFYRVDKARSRELGGTGLGLSIVKHIALAHGGKVSVESEPGKGSTFRVILPLQNREG